MELQAPWRLILLVALAFGLALAATVFTLSDPLPDQLLPTLGLSRASRDALDTLLAVTLAFLSLLARLGPNSPIVAPVAPRA